MSPFGPTTAASVNIDFGYRGELETIPGVHLRARTLLPGLATMGTLDPLAGVVGTSTFTTQYHYADNDPIGHVDPLGLRASDLTIQPAPAYLVEGRSGGIANQIRDTIRLCITVHWECENYLSQGQSWGPIPLREVQLAMDYIDDLIGLGWLVDDGYESLLVDALPHGNNTLSWEVYGDSYDDFTVVTTTNHVGWREAFTPGLQALALVGDLTAVGAGLTCAATVVTCPVATPIALAGLGLSLGANSLTALLNCGADVDGGITCATALAGAALSVGGLKGTLALNAAVTSGTIDFATFSAASYYLAIPTMLLDSGAYALARSVDPGDSRPPAGAVITMVSVDYDPLDGEEVGRLMVWRRREAS